MAFRACMTDGHRIESFLSLLYRLYRKYFTCRVVSVCLSATNIMWEEADMRIADEIHEIFARYVTDKSEV